MYRPGGANIIEQKQAVMMAAAQRAEALVVECMALQPHRHWLSESKLVRATHGVITNARPDHLDVMGPNEEDVAHALAATVPVGGVFFTAERTHRAFFQQVCEDRGTKFRGSEEISSPVTEDDLEGFSYLEHKDNVELALSVCEELGIDKDTALRGMWRAKPDPGAMTEADVEFFGRRIVFVNGFAANDPESTRKRKIHFRTCGGEEWSRPDAFGIRRSDASGRHLRNLVGPRWVLGSGHGPWQHCRARIGVGGVLRQSGSGTCRKLSC